MKKGWGVEVLREIRCVGAKVGADVELFVLNFLEISDAQAPNDSDGCREKTDTIQRKTE